MQALTVNTEGKLVLGQVSEMAVPADWVELEVKAAGVNRADLLQMAGHYPPPPGASDLLGLEVAGVVVRDQGPWKQGQRVMALLDGGGYAERAWVPRGQLMPLPDNLSFIEGAAIPEAFVTAYQALVIIGDLGPGERLLIHAGASGVGSAAIQLGRVLGAEVTVTCGSQAKVAFCHSLGADRAINYRQGDWWEGVAEQDLILDMVGGHYLEPNLRSLALDGRIITLAMQGGRHGTLDYARLLAKRATLTGSTLRNRSSHYKARLVQGFLRRFSESFVSGELRPVVDSSYPWQQVAQAHKRMAANENQGKLILSLESS
ncbi:NAD(P)H-quinone oxidoreductase [Ferrimonas futtsuensis]|uniref:NAD(P)H-quinone oxidoreductase n=1 Tax=Ferrimonas futtsuensis TaxID=364764 RepID=UPI0003FC36A1|nr:NAD(P)H-quinone oxidoreductase [Ferrimonas futtsuensis]